jgi:benzoyl-CoA reductase/2-hydroxyglutaryl-CoA dehydratase subunit BcrC/BadD/HgdB
VKTDFDNVDVEVVCSRCGQIHIENMPEKIANDAEIWRISGYIVVTCKDCKPKKIKVGVRK